MSNDTVSETPCPDKTAALMVRRGGALANFSWLSAGLIASRLLQFVVTIYLTRVLLVEAFGLFNFVQAFLWFGVILTDFGLSAIGTREIASDPRRLRILSSVILVWRLTVFAVEMLLIVALLPAFHPGPQLYWLFIFSFLSLLAYAINTDWLFRGLERMRYVAVWEALPRVIWLASIVLFVHSPADLLKVPLLRFAGEIATTVVLLVVAWRRYPDSRLARQALHPLHFKILAREVLPVGIAGLLAQVYYNVDTILLGVLKNQEMVGQYSAAYRVVTLLLTGTFLLGATWQPILARTFASDRSAFARHMRRLMAGAFLFGVTLPAAVAIGAVPVVRLLYGRPLRSIGHTADGPDGGCPLCLPRYRLQHGPCGGWNAGTNDDRHGGGGAAVNVIANLLLIPPLGMNGAAIATVISYAAAWAIQWWYVHRCICPGEAIPLKAVIETIRELPDVLRRRGG